MYIINTEGVRFLESKNIFKLLEGVNKKNRGNLM